MDRSVYDRMPVGFVFKNNVPVDGPAFNYGLLIKEEVGRDNEFVYPVLMSGTLKFHDDSSRLGLEGSSYIAGSIVNGYYKYLEEGEFSDFCRENESLLDKLGIVEVVRTASGVERAESTCC